MANRKNSRIISAYALLFTIAAGVLTADSLSRQTPLPDFPSGKRVNTAAAPVSMAPAVSRAKANAAAPEVALSQIPARGNQLPAIREAKPTARHNAAPTSPRLSPPGVFYVTARVSHVDAVGVHALTPGAQVKLLRRKGKRLKVTDGRHDFDVSEEQVTRDLDKAEALAQQYAAPQRFASY